MNNELIEQLSKLKLEYSCLKRNLDRYYCDEEARTKLFYRIKDVKKKIDNINFKLRLERELKKNEDNSND